ncbi:MAG: extracellular solute-binding protein [Anaerolineae bacterium]|nr:extracellular solute-binding protein [Anaerolineae bacterium]MDW8100215.1 extracellular solute-binding protein [Anaerolineae bacterium]
MKWPRRILQLAVIILLLGNLATGCGGRATPTPEPRTVQFIVYNLPAGLLAPYQRLAKEFHAAHPELTVEVKAASGSAALRSALDGGADAVLAWSWAFNDIGELRPLDPFLETEPSTFLPDYLPSALDAVRRQGQIIALPADLDVLVLYFNKDLFDQTSTPYPAPGWTWNDFVTLAQSVTQPLADGAIQYGFYPSDALPAYLPFVAQEMAALWGDDLLSPQALRLDGEPVIRAIQWYADLALAHRVMPTPAEARRQTADPIALGRAPMWLGWMSERGGRLDGIEWKFRWGVAPLPRGSTDRTILIMTVYAIPTSSPRPEDAWRWIRFLADHFEQNSALPARQSLLRDAELRQSLGDEHADVFVQAAMAGILASPSPQFEVYAAALDQAVRDVFERDLPVEEALRRAQQRAEATGG